MNDSSIKLDTGSLRSKLARLGAVLSGGLIIGLNALAVLLLAGGMLAVFSSLAIGWLVIGLSALPAMIAQWSKHELKHPAKVEGSIDGVLARRSL